MNQGNTNENKLYKSKKEISSTSLKKINDSQKISKGKKMMSKKINSKKTSQRVSHGMNKFISLTNKLKNQRENAIISNDINNKSIGIISLNVEGELFPKTIDDKLKARFESFQNLDIVVAGFQEEKKKSGSVQFIEQLLPNHILIVEEYMSGIGKVGFRGNRMLVFVHLTKTSLKSSLKTINLCDNSSCLLGLPCCNKGLNAAHFFDDLVIINSHIVLGVHKLLFKEAINSRVCMMESLFKRLKNELKWSNITNKKIIWFGDLNFRVSPQIQTNDEFYKFIQENIELSGKNIELSAKKLKSKNLKAKLNNSFNIESYIQNDELKKLLEGNYKKENLKCIFPLDLYEEKITFNPTCKLEKGSEDVYNVISNNRIRLPSWCDRILFNENIKNQYDVKYESVSFPVKTDHNTVLAILTPKSNKAEL